MLMEARYNFPEVPYESLIIKNPLGMPWIYEVPTAAISLLNIYQLNICRYIVTKAVNMYNATRILEVRYSFPLVHSEL